MMASDAESNAIEEWHIRTIRGYKEALLKNLHDEFMAAYEKRKSYIESIPFDEDACLKYEARDRKAKQERNERELQISILRGECKVLFKEKYPELDTDDPLVAEMYLAFERAEIDRRNNEKVKANVRKYLVKGE